MQVLLVSQHPAIVWLILGILGTLETTDWKDDTVDQSMLSRKMQPVWSHNQRIKQKRFVGMVN